MTEYYRCTVCRMYHRRGFNFERDGELRIEVVNGYQRLVEPPAWVWGIPPETKEIDQ
jgi:hypothetical protein